MLRSIRNIAMERLYLVIKSYEDVIGLSEVKLAQQRVLSAERDFADTQDLRRNGQVKMQDIQVKLKEIQVELDKTSRVEDRYLDLVTKEHSIIKDERRLLEELRLYEKEERDKFSSLTNAVRESHEKERSYSEKTKYWSVIGSVMGATVGIVGTAYNNRRRIQELRNIVTESTASSSATIQEIRSLFTEDPNDGRQQERIVTALINKLTAGLQLHNNNTVESDLRSAEKNISDKLEEMKLFLNEHFASTVRNAVDDSSHAGSAIYIGRDVEKIIKDTENRLQTQMHKSSAITIALIYGAIAVSIGVAFKFFNS